MNSRMSPSRSTSAIMPPTHSPRKPLYSASTETREPVRTRSEPTSIAAKPSRSRPLSRNWLTNEVAFRRALMLSAALRFSMTAAISRLLASMSAARMASDCRTPAWSSAPIMERAVRAMPRRPLTWLRRPASRSSISCAVISGIASRMAAVASASLSSLSAAERRTLA